MLNYHWPLTSAGSLSQLPEMLTYHWPLTLLSQSPGMLNSYWLSGIQFQSSRMLNYHWWKTQAASPCADEAATSWEACERRLVAADFLDFLKVQGRSGRSVIEWEEEWGHVPNSDTSPNVAGSHHPLVRPHTRDNIGGSLRRGGRGRQTVIATKSLVA